VEGWIVLRTGEKAFIAFELRLDAGFILRIVMNHKRLTGQTATW
jgi:hypothetical protein